MKTHWPLGKGSHTRSLVHTALAGGLGAFVLFLAMASALPERTWLRLDLAGALRTWTLVMFAVLTLEVALLYLLRPGVLRLLLPTPTDRDTMYRVLDPTRGTWLLVIPYAFGLLAGLARVSEIGGPWAIVWMLFACMLMRALVPLLVLAAVMLRKLLLPAGHWIVWGALVAGAGGLACGVSMGWAEAVLLAGTGSRWLWIVLGLALIPVGSLLRPACNRLAARLVGREELVEYAFPVEIEKRSKPTRMLVDVLGKVFGERPRVRRFVYLVQESAGLHRPRDWAKAGLVWLVVFAGLLYALRNVGGSAAHMGVTLGATFAVVVWAVLRRLRIVRGKLATESTGSALPVGYMEIYGAQVLLFSLVFVVTGVLAAAGVRLVSEPAPAGPANVADVGMLRACCETLGQTTILLAALWAALSGLALKRARAKKFDFRLRNLLDGVIMWSLYCGVGCSLYLSALHVLTAGRGRFTVFAEGLRGILFVASLLCRGVVTEDAFYSALLNPYAAHNIAPLWHFEILAWAVPALVLAYFLAVLRRVGRGRAHPSYRSIIPPAMPKFLARDLAARPTG